MNQNTLIKISFITFLLSFFSIIVYEKFTETDISKIASISLKDINKNVLISGNLIKIKKYKQHQFLTIKDNTSIISVLVFYSNNTNFIKNQNYNVLGKITFNDNKLEIIASKIDLNFK